MVHHIGKRWLLVSLLTGAQMVCMFTALIVFDAWLAEQVESTVHSRIKRATEQTTAYLVQMIALMEIDDVGRESAGWKKLQRVVEQTNLPDGGHLCIIGKADGKVICHPDLLSKPEIANMKPGRGLPGEIAGAYSYMTESADGVMFVTARDLAGLDARLLVHHREDEINEVVAAFVGRVRNIGILFVLMLACATALISMLLIRRYENRLAAANEHLLDANAKLGIANAALADMNQHLEDKVADRTTAVRRGRDAVVFGLAKLAESRDNETGQHLERICQYVEILGGQFIDNGDPKVNPKWLRTVTTTAALHDIGKVGIGDHILQKAGRLTDEERKVMETHTFIGGDALIALKQRWGEDAFLITAAQIALSHHEKWDGSGYPYGLKGEDIPLEARIVALADVYDALTSKRVYKDAMTHGEAKRIILDGKGSHFDPAVVEAFLRIEDDFNRIARELGD